MTNPSKPKTTPERLTDPSDLRIQPGVVIRIQGDFELTNQEACDQAREWITAADVYLVLDEPYLPTGGESDALVQG